MYLLHLIKLEKMEEDRFQNIMKKIIISPINLGMIENRGIEGKQILLQVRRS